MPALVLKSEQRPAVRAVCPPPPPAGADAPPRTRMIKLFSVQVKRMRPSIRVPTRCSAAPVSLLVTSTSEHEHAALHLAPAGAAARHHRGRGSAASAACSTDPRDLLSLSSQSRLGPLALMPRLAAKMNAALSALPQAPRAGPGGGPGRPGGRRPGLGPSRRGSGPRRRPFPVHRAGGPRWASALWQ